MPASSSGPHDIKAIDLMFGIPVSEDSSELYDFLKPLLMDEQSRQRFKMPAQYMFKDIPQSAGVEDKLRWTVEQMDLFGIEKAMVSYNAGRAAAMGAYWDRFLYSYEVNPNLGMEEVRKIRELKRDHDIVAVTAFPAGLNPQVPINDKRFYPIYAECVNLGLPIFICTGICGPRIPSLCQ